jgi:hypothetical protein
VDQGQNAVFTVTATGSGTLVLFVGIQFDAPDLLGNQRQLHAGNDQDPGRSFPVGVDQQFVGHGHFQRHFDHQSLQRAAARPVITAEPASLAVNAGGTAVFSVAATGTSLSYQWQLNNSNLTDSASISGATTPTLTLSNVFGGSAGSYT